MTDGIGLIASVALCYQALDQKRSNSDIRRLIQSGSIQLDAT